MRITFIGDVHGKWDLYADVLAGIPGRSIQIGDMGMGFGGRKTLRLPDNAKWFRGNHDNPELCRQHPNYMGDYGVMELGHDGGEYGGSKLFWLAGAYSIDYLWRKEGVSWWRDEELSYPELSKAIDLYEKVKPEYVCSHEAPTAAATWMLTQVLQGFRQEKLVCGQSRTSVALQQMFNIHKPKEWVFGHYHANKSFEWRGTKFTCVGELCKYTITDEPLIVVPGEENATD